MHIAALLDARTLQLKVPPHLPLSLGTIHCPHHADGETEAQGDQRTASKFTAKLARASQSPLHPCLVQPPRPPPGRLCSIPSSLQLSLAQLRTARVLVPPCQPLFQHVISLPPIAPFALCSAQAASSLLTRDVFAGGHETAPAFISPAQVSCSSLCVLQKALGFPRGAWGLVCCSPSQGVPRYQEMGEGTRGQEPFVSPHSTVQL